MVQLAFAVRKLLVHLDPKGSSTRLPHLPSDGPVTAARSTLRARCIFLVNITIRLLIVSLPILLVCWTFSSRRIIEIEISKTSCRNLSPFLLARQGRQGYYASQDFKIDPVKGISDSRAAVTILQVCAIPHRDSPYLRQLIDNHQAYAIKSGLGYDLVTGGKADTWQKIRALREKIAHQLSLDVEERLQWIFFTDMDTWIVDTAFPIYDFLPPSDEPAFIVISSDHNGLNTGVMFLRIDPRTITFLDKIMNASSKNLHFAEQSAMANIVQQDRMEERGEVIMVPQGWFNSYWGIEVYRQGINAFQVHWPSRSYKRTGMFPLLDQVRSGQLRLSEEDLISRRDGMRREVNDFYRARAERRVISHD